MLTNEKVGFWCDSCRLDSELFAIVSGSSGVRWFEARCPVCRAKVIRHIDDKAKDPYYVKSEKLNVERKEYSNDLLQPGKEGFSVIFDKAAKKIEEAAVAYEKRKREVEEDR